MPFLKTATSWFEDSGSPCAQRQLEMGEDWLLVKRIQAGEAELFDHLIKKYQERLYGIVYNLCSNKEDASEITQDAFIKAFRSIFKFQGKSSFFTWLYKIAINTTYNALRKNRFKRFFSLEKISSNEYTDGILDCLPAKEQTDKPVLLNELQERLNEAMQKLSINHRTVIVLFEIEGLSHAEIAQIMGSSEGTVRSRLHYAKQELQAYLKDYLQ